MAIPKDTIDEIRQLVDVVDVVSQVVTLKKTGNHFSGLCPFHREKTPSFKVFPESQNFHCFGCGEGGSVFDFVMKTEGLSFPEAVRQLADRVGVSVPQHQSDGEEDRLVREISETLELATRFYVTQLGSDSGRGARRYLERRGLSAETIERFRLGFAPVGWDNLIQAMARFRDGAALERAGLAVPGRRSGGHYDRFRGRVMFPIVSPAGGVVGFGGRSLGEEEPKYLNTPETAVYHKNRVLYGLREARPRIRQENRVLVVEGYTDVLALHDAGFADAVATCGTALTPAHGAILARHAREIVLLFDGDDAGVRAALKAFEVLLPTGAAVHAVLLPGGRDPDDIVRQDGPARLQELMEQRQDVVDFFYARSRGEPRPAAIDRLGRLIALVPGEIQRRDLVARASDWFKFDEGTFASVVEKQARGRSAPSPARAMGRAARQPQGLEADLLRAGLQDPEFLADLEPLTRRPDIRGAVEARVRPSVLDLLRQVARSGVSASPAAYRDRVEDPELQAFLMELASEGIVDDERLYRLERDIVGRLPRLALEDEREQLRRRLNEAVRRSDGDAQSKILTRLQDINLRLNELGRGEDRSSSPAAGENVSR